MLRLKLFQNALCDFKGCSSHKPIIYTIAIKLSIFYTILIFKVMKNNLSFGFYLTCTLVFWLPNLDKFDLFHLPLSMNGELTTQYCPGVDMQE